VQFKRGDTFSFIGEIQVQTIDNETLADLTGWTGESQIRTDGLNLVADLDFAWLDATNCVCQLHFANTDEWPLGKVFIDIKLTSPAGGEIRTETDSFEIIEGITR